MGEKRARHHVYQSVEHVDRVLGRFRYPWDRYNPVTLNHIVKAGELHATLSTIPRGNPVWQSLRSFWAALTSYPADHRYPLFWMGLESLFGSDDKNWKVTK